MKHRGPDLSAAIDVLDSLIACKRATVSDLVADTGRERKSVHAMLHRLHARGLVYPLPLAGLGRREARSREWAASDKGVAYLEVGSRATPVRCGGARG